MRAARRRTRRPDPLASHGAVRAVLSQLQERNELAASLSEKQLIKLLEAARHMERRPAADAVRGRPSRWPSWWDWSRHSVAWLWRSGS